MRGGGYWRVRADGCAPQSVHRVSGSSSHYVRVNSPQKPPTAPTTRYPGGHGGSGPSSTRFFGAGHLGAIKEEKKHV